MAVGNVNILVKIREIKDSLTAAEQKVANSILEDPEDIPQMSIKLLSQRSGASEASVLRFCKTMGYTGFREFIVSITSALALNTEEKAYNDLRPGDELSAIIRAISKSNVQSIEDTISVLDAQEVEKAIEGIKNARRIYFFGIGASNLVCVDAAYKFLRINMECFTWEDSHQQLAMATLLTPKDVVILVSNSGNTKEIIDILDVVKKQKAMTIGITRYSRSLLAEKADIVLSISTPETYIRSGAMGSRIAMLTVIDILFTGVASEEYGHIKDFLKKTRNILREKLRR